MPCSLEGLKKNWRLDNDVVFFGLMIIVTDLKKMKVNLNESLYREGIKFKQMPVNNIQCQFVVLFHHIHAVSLTIIACVQNDMDIHGHQSMPRSYFLMMFHHFHTSWSILIIHKKKGICCWLSQKTTHQVGCKYWEKNNPVCFFDNPQKLPTNHDIITMT